MSNPTYLCNVARYLSILLVFTKSGDRFLPLFKSFLHWLSIFLNVFESVFITKVYTVVMFSLGGWCFKVESTDTYPRFENLEVASIPKSSNTGFKYSLAKSLRPQVFTQVWYMESS